MTTPIHQDHGLRARLGTILRGVQPVVSDAASAYTAAYRQRLDPRAFPLAPLLRVVMVAIGCRDLGRAEKLDWEYAFTVDRIMCSLSSEKFGLRLYIDGTCGEEAALSDRLLRMLNAAQ